MTDGHERLKSTDKAQLAGVKDVRVRLREGSADPAKFAKRAARFSFLPFAFHLVRLNVGLVIPCG